MSANAHTIVLPAEWAPQAFVQLTFPHRDTDWGYMLDEVNACFVAIARAIAARERLLVVCQNRNEVATLLSDIASEHLQIVTMAVNDTWARDHGAITCFVDGRPTLYDFQFNGWGLKFAANHDNRITRQLYEQGLFGSEVGYRDCLDFVLEGGSIESDGRGTLLTTAQCLSADNRNNLDEAAIDHRLKTYFGAERILWLHHGYLAGDDTDSHVDTLARFCDEGTIAYVSCDDADDEHYAELRLMEEELQAFRRADGEPYRLIALPMTDAIYDENEERLPATYANFLIMNGAVLVPTYAVPQDEEALRLIQTAFPDRKISAVDCRALIRQHGSLHCVTMQYPAEVL